MAIIKKKSFIELISDDISENQYLGLGNPDSNILLVGNEKALGENDNSIIKHELELNVSHWRDIINGFNHLHDPFHNDLSNRLNPFKGFNPLNPLLYNPTANRVMGKSGHTYYGINRLINKLELNNNLIPSGIFKKSFAANTFSKVFLTELNAAPARTSSQANFSLMAFQASSRYKMMTSTLGMRFFNSFKTVIIYCGKNNRYVGNNGSQERLNIIQIFNPSLSHADLQITGDIIFYDQRSKGPRVILCRHLSSGFSNAKAQEVASLILV
jgi:hypothetical protein